MKLFEETGDVRPRTRQNGPIPPFGEYEQLDSFETNPTKPWYLFT